MPILKREPDQFPPDLMRTEYESLRKAQEALTNAAAEGDAGDQSDAATVGQGAIDCEGAIGQRLIAERALEAEAGVPQEQVSGVPESSRPLDQLVQVGGPSPRRWEQDFGSFSYFTEYLGAENPPKPLTFWSGDWDDFQKFDPTAKGWWCLYTHSRQEKVLMRHLLERKLSFYCPLIEKRYRSPQGRIRSSFLPLFTNYVFLRGTDDDRRLALTTNCVLTSKPIQQPDYLVTDLFQISVAVDSGVPITAEQKLEKGAPVRVKSGPFKGFEGFVQRRAGATRFLIFLRYLEQGVSMEIDEGALVAM
jgi:transcription antitermination factor NusG